MNLFKYEFKKLFKPMIIWTVVCVVCIVLFMSFYPMMEDSGMQEFVGDKLEVMPEAMKEAFNLSGTVDFSKLSDYTCNSIYCYGIWHLWCNFRSFLLSERGK